MGDIDGRDSKLLLELSCISLAVLAFLQIA
jgi:hypothetical protein